MSEMELTANEQRVVTWMRELGDDAVAVVMRRECAEDLYWRDMEADYKIEDVISIMLFEQGVHMNYPPFEGEDDPDLGRKEAWDAWRDGPYR